MKNLKSLLTLCAILMMGLSFNSCEQAEDLITTPPDPCATVTCQNNGTCDDGSCACPDGFSGTNCEIEDKCVTQNPDCQNGGNCDDGSCVCLDGFEGIDCSTKWNEKFLGDHTMNGVCNNNPNNPFGPWSASIVVDPNEDMKISGTYIYAPGGSRTWNANLITSTTFEIPQQNIGGTLNGYGTGSIDENGKIIILWTNSSNNAVCTWTLTPN